MKILTDTYKKTGQLHHAYCIIGDHEETLSELCLFLQHDVGIVQKGNPDFVLEQFETLGIDESRKLTDWNTTKSFGNNKKIFILSTAFATHEAQNALLKIFEEPAADTHFFIIAPSAEIFLPTLRSRFVIVDAGNRIQSDNDSFIESYLQRTVPECLKLLGTLIEEKDKNGALHFLKQLERGIYQKIKGKTDTYKKHAPVLQNILTCIDYVGDRSPSVKMILEHVSCVLSVIR